MVALLAEGVDRNVAESSFRAIGSTVALLVEGVDRNMGYFMEIHDGTVALLTEGVDRNDTAVASMEAGYWSPSSRRAWIEIPVQCSGHPLATSPSSRRAWIEILPF